MSPPEVAHSAVQLLPGESRQSIECRGRPWLPWQRNLAAEIYSIRHTGLSVCLVCSLVCIIAFIYCFYLLIVYIMHFLSQLFAAFTYDNVYGSVVNVPLESEM